MLIKYFYMNIGPNEAMLLYIGSYEAKYQLLISKRVSTGLKYFNDSEAFIDIWWYDCWYA